MIADLIERFETFKPDMFAPADDEFKGAPLFVPSIEREVERIVNEKIKEAIPVEHYEISNAEADKMGAIGLFSDKYGDVVSVYKIGDFSIEKCGGPHVKNTSELGTFKIVKEEGIGAGMRRIKATLTK